MVLIAVAIVVWPHSHHGGATSPTSTTTSTSTSAQADPTAPLTGLADPSRSALTRPALTVKIENDTNSWPQWGVDKADVVYEEIVNGGITRLAAVFNSQAPTKVGPVRSVRPTDTQVVWPIGGIFAFSGGAAYAMASISTAPVKLVDESSAGAAMFRDPNRQAPYNLYAHAAQLFAMKGKPTPPPPLFSYRTASQTVTGPAVSGFTVKFPSIFATTWKWDTATASWDRSMYGKADFTGTGVRESPKNVVVMWVNYANGIGTMASYANLQGSGKVAVFTNAKEVQGTWSRGPSKADPIVYKTNSGKVIGMTPGQTWVELLNVGAPVNITK